MAVTSEQVAAYLPLITIEARKHTGKYGAELDDLIQEGMIAVWWSLENEADDEVYLDNIRRGMQRWVAIYRGRYSVSWEDELADVFNR